MNYQLCVHNLLCPNLIEHLLVLNFKGRNLHNSIRTSFDSKNIIDTDSFVSTFPHLYSNDYGLIYAILNTKFKYCNSVTTFTVTYCFLMNS